MEAAERMTGGVKRGLLSKPPGGRLFAACLQQETLGAPLQRLPPPDALTHNSLVSLTVRPRWFRATCPSWKDAGFARASLGALQMLYPSALEEE